MNEQKAGFLFYFDNYPALVSLPPEQRGWLVTALYVYADRVWREEVQAQEILEQFPQLSDQTRVAYQFMAGNICRDTRKWLRTCQIRAQRRQQQPRSGGGTQGVSLEEQERRSLENRGRLERLVEQFREDR